MPIKKKLSLLARSKTWGDLARDAAWRLRSKAPDPLPLSWPLEPEVAKAISIRWPARYGWANAPRWITPILSGLRQLVEVERADIQQPVGNIVLFEFVLDGSSHIFGIDYEDREDNLHEMTDTLPLTFKMTCLKEGYGRGNVVPGGYVSNKHKLYRVFPRLRDYRARSKPLYELQGRFGGGFGAEVRWAVMRHLEGPKSFEFEGGIEKQTMIWSGFMRDACRAKLCLELPGRGPWSSRTVDYLAAGIPMIGPEPLSTLHVPLVNHEHAVFARRDLEDLIPLCERYLADDAARERISANARDYFDRYLRPEQLGAYYVHECVRAARS